MRQIPAGEKHPLIREAAIGAWELRRSAAVLGALLLAAALVATAPFHSLVADHLSRSSLSAEQLRSASPDALVDFGVHRGNRLTPAAAGLMAILLVTAFGGLLLGPGLLAQAALGAPRPAFETLVRGGLRHGWRSVRLLALVAATALVPLALVGAAGKALETRLEIPLMDERLYLAFVAVRGLAFGVVFLLARGAWSVARLESIRSRVGLFRAWLAGWSFVLRRPGRSIALEGAALLASIAALVVPVGLALVVSGTSAPAVGLQAALLATAVFLFPAPRVFAAAGWARWHREEIEDAASEGSGTIAPRDIETQRGPGPDLLEESPSASPASSDAFSLPPSAGIELIALPEPPSPQRERPSKEVTAPLRIDPSRATPHASRFPANLPKGLGLEVIAVPHSTPRSLSVPGIDGPPFPESDSRSAPSPDDVPTDPIRKPFLDDEPTLPIPTGTSTEPPRGAGSTSDSAPEPEPEPEAKVEPELEPAGESPTTPGEQDPGSNPDRKTADD